ncbi:DUF6691 family protein [Oxalobacter formigenes]|uniref:YeeE/YedE family protein n=1 Tax=Oxalobacter formigenes OXCC13 TaxID=556269 RepID=C3X957_OXAFO|nr:DUF6691 family protein [Oxalobacter formigenes]ARQ46201.1 hypothetical protein BRW83_1460 [Oxalobacter formigenes]ARQ78329.1 hypothetical protein BRW84_06705 [Oxalobacter formigenes OXCC13]EEO29733.1 YeeE/YedE family protein [Oxalobacter formigenes OXCC13]MCZ4062777.1 YeeE/YedE family protein [Oxalobacter formigenes]QDX33073.1 YeeE/YedE family protein [Oxalobacter formigenes]
MFNIVAFLSGLIFGIGLILSRMADPAKVLNFLDITGNWDPSLAFVMIGAIAVGLVGFYLARKRPASLLDTPIQLPTATRIDKRLVLGSSLFGTGWGLAGICPGPAIVTLSAGMAPALIFVISMLFGMMLYRWTFHA